MVNFKARETFLDLHLTLINGIDFCNAPLLREGLKYPPTFDALAA
jgi:hypothetical protein